MRYPLYLVTALALAVTACGGDHVKQVARADNTVSYTILNEDEQDIAEQRANDYCQRYFGHPAVRLADVPERREHTLKFACKRPA